MGETNLDGKGIKISIYLKEWGIGYFHTWYDCQIHVLTLGPVEIAWEGWPFIDR